MLAQVLALAVGIGSILIYLFALFFPEIHRKNDFIWSGVGLFYGLVLWIFARRITGGLLLGHVASVALLGWLGWQTMSLRRQVVSLAQQTQISTPSPALEETHSDDKKQVAKVASGNHVSGLIKGLGGLFAGNKKESPTTETTTLDKAAIDTSASDTVVDDTEEIESTTRPATTETPLEETTEAKSTAEMEVTTSIPEQPPEGAPEAVETETEAIPSTPPSVDVEAVQTETELPTPEVTKEVVSDTEPAPSELSTEEKPPSEQKK